MQPFSKFGTSYHPQTQGVVERMKNVFSQTLHCLLTKSGVKYWEQLLAIMKMNINSSLNLSTEYTPFLLNYGFHPVALTELLSGDEISTVKYVQNFVCRSKTLCNTDKEICRNLWSSNFDYIIRNIEQWNLK